MNPVFVAIAGIVVVVAAHVGVATNVDVVAGVVGLADCTNASF